MRRYANRVLIVLFLLAITVPTVEGLLLDYRTILVSEKRRANDCPKLARKSLKFFPQQFEMFFSDHLGYRDSLTQLSRDLRWNWFGLSPIPNLITGEFGWLYHDFEGLHDDGKSTAIRENVQSWRRLLESRHDWLTARGIGYVTVFAPEKQTIYPECLPRKLQRKIAPFTPHDELVEAMAGSRARVVDLRPTLIEGKAIEPMYFVRDTHWLPAGALRASRLLISAMLDHFDGTKLWTTPYTDWIGEHVADLSVMLGVPSEERTDPWVIYRPVGADPCLSSPLPDDYRIENPLTHMKGIVLEYKQSRGPKVVLVHDSFGTEFAIHLAPHCRRLVCVPASTLPYSIIEAEKPDVVIVEMAERRISIPITMFPETPPIGKVAAHR